MLLLALFNQSHRCRSSCNGDSSNDEILGVRPQPLGRQHAQAKIGEILSQIHHLITVHVSTSSLLIFALRIDTAPTGRSFILMPFPMFIRGKLQRFLQEKCLFAQSILLFLRSGQRGCPALAEWG
jgi:hypothetical protein